MMVVRKQSQMRDKVQESLISFNGEYRNYCIGIVDIVNSTKIAAKMPPVSLGIYYSIFLNKMADIAVRFDASVVKNIGDSLLFYFPSTVNSADMKGFQNAIECGLSMIESRCMINNIMFESRLPSISYRVSIDYGTVLIAVTLYDTVDIFGPPVNVCAKINREAHPNGMVIGGDMFQMVKAISSYQFKQICSFSSGLKSSYPVYSILRRNALH
ncbi:adenylate/guanylate cyclase domain-containing protein [Candidatus Nitrosopumilus sediminis]|uniref:Adenylate/guanylate cyclase with integral membrane sensor n=1 Tax=Candidatus Nitrosopumilus sediminis TaxID=1229909 RepID=K0BAD9_9ARCH|nr:adenylate/guanylate cyclase domain-containing protein [Candidatus Nitrosopumilus sediminis]AFS81915.1 adenylate/guanylate cyclase with integral membrane sensor [Candidatus Nitrosopumilus sediminis]